MQLAHLAGLPSPRVLHVLGLDDDLGLGSDHLRPHRASSWFGRHEYIYRHYRRYRITEGSEEIRKRKVAGFLFGYMGPGKR